MVTPAMDERGIGIADDPRDVAALNRSVDDINERWCFGCSAPIPARVNSFDHKRHCRTAPADLTIIDRQRETRTAACRIIDAITDGASVRPESYTRLHSTIYSLLYDGEIHGDDAARIIRRWVR